jgi:hypothetical protein
MHFFCFLFPLFYSPFLLVFRFISPNARPTRTPIQASGVLLQHTGARIPTRQISIIYTASTFRPVSNSILHFSSFIRLFPSPDRASHGHRSDRASSVRSSASRRCFGKAERKGGRSMGAAAGWRGKFTSGCLCCAVTAIVRVVGGGVRDGALLPCDAPVYGSKARLRQMPRNSAFTPIEFKISETK